MCLKDKINFNISANQNSSLCAYSVSHPAAKKNLENKKIKDRKIKR
jgi:hypothetical protein